MGFARKTMPKGSEMQNLNTCISLGHKKTDGEGQYKGQYLHGIK